MHSIYGIRQIKLLTPTLHEFTILHVCNTVIVYTQRHHNEAKKPAIVLKGNRVKGNRVTDRTYNVYYQMTSVFIESSNLVRSHKHRQ